MVRNWIANGEIVSTCQDYITDARTLAAQIAVLKTIKNYNLERVISFHNNINRAKNFVTDFSKILELIEENNRPSGKFWIEHVDGTMSAGKRREFINNLKSLEVLMSACLLMLDVYPEGVDVPSLDGVAFIDPKGSQVDIIQAVGRAIRKTENKKIGTIILPVFLEKGDSAETIIEASNFKPVWDVLKALRAHDEILADKLDKYRTETGLQVVKKLDGIGKIIFDLPTNVGKKFSESLFVRTVEQTTEDWKLYLGQLKRYKNQYGDLDVPQSFSFENGNLGGWVSGVRQGKSALTEKRLAELNELGFIWNSVQFKWDKAIGYLKLYVEEHGHADVPFPYTIDGFKLGQWVNARQK